MTDQLKEPLLKELLSGGVIDCEHGLPFGKGCKECADALATAKADEAKKLADIQAGIKHSEQQSKIDSRLKSSMITAKFQNARLSNYNATEPGQRLAMQKINDFIDGFEIDHYDLVMIGGPGTGKDHLAAAIGHEMISAGKTALIIDLEKIQRKIRDCYKSKDISEQSIMDKLAEVDYLAVNEMGTRTSDAQAAMLNEICNDRVNNLKRTVYIGNLTVEEFKKLVGSRAYDRIVKKDGSNIIIFDWPSYRP